MSQKPAMRVRTTDGKPREWKALHGALGGQTFVRVYAHPGNVEFIITADTSKQLDGIRGSFAKAGVEEIVGGNTTIPATTAANAKSKPPHRQGTFQQPRVQPPHGGDQRRPQPDRPIANQAPSLSKKPYGFVSLPKDLTTAPPIWHDGTSSKDRLSGEIRFELESLTPLLVGWESGRVGDKESDWPLPEKVLDVPPLVDEKSVLCPLRATWGKRPVIIPGDSLKGLLRHELGALCGAPMERVAERSYSYRPNALFPNHGNPRLIARIARVPNDGVQMRALDEQTNVRVPARLELLPTTLRYDPRRRQESSYYRFDDHEGGKYRGGQGAGQRLNSKRELHRTLNANPKVPTETMAVDPPVQDNYLETLRHLTDVHNGHFSSRHPDVITKVIASEAARDRILKAAKDEVFQPGDLIWVEWDTESKRVVSLGWHYYYRWAYTDTVRKDADAPRLERHGLFPLEAERSKDDDLAPQALSSVRRLFGYTGDNEGSANIGDGDHSQLMGRIFANAALEVVDDHESKNDRFLTWTFLKELGQPRPSTVEHYLKQPHHPRSRPSDKATLVTYGDAIGYDTPGELSGRKFYLDRKDAYDADGKGLVPGPAADHSNDNAANKRSTLALEASKPGRKFRFTVRFRDLDSAELAAILVALCPDQFKSVLGGTHAAGYCSKLGYARPLGWGSVRIAARSMFLLDEFADNPTLQPQVDLDAWVSQHHHKTANQDEWLAIHRRHHPDAADYPVERDRDGDEHIYTYHTNRRAEHSRYRRYGNEGPR